jgi:predicted dehydrogenase
MNSKMHRRSFLKRTAVAAGALSSGPFLGFPNLLSAREPSDILNCVQIGCGGRGGTHLEQVIVNQKQRLVAMVDPDDRQIASKRKWLQDKFSVQTDQLQSFSDYRVMFDKLDNQIDTVFVTAPNHHHAAAAMLAMQAGKNVYCEKPLCHDIAQCRELSRASLRYNKVATMMGNQGHCEGGYRRLCEFIWGGVIGNVTETHSWTDRANGGEGPRPPTLPVPPGMHWDSWIGPAPYRDFHSDLHPHEWHGWYDFGNGSIGNMGCHVLEGVFWALKAEHPASVEMEFVRGGSDERYPLGSRVRWDIPARGDMPPCKAYWYEGLNPTTTETAQGGLHAVRGAARNLPPLLAELQAKYPDEEMDKNPPNDSGSLYVGDKGIIFTGTYGGKMHILPLEKMNEIQQPPITLPRPNSNPFIDFVQTCRAGRTDTATPFEYGARLTEFCLLGNLAQHAGPGNKVEWDGQKMKVTNLTELNQWIKRDHRAGWIT